MPRQYAGSDDFGRVSNKAVQVEYQRGARRRPDGGQPPALDRSGTGSTSERFKGIYT